MREPRAAASRAASRERQAGRGHTPPAPDGGDDAAGGDRTLRVDRGRHQVARARHPRGGLPTSARRFSSERAEGPEQRRRPQRAGGRRPRGAAGGRTRRLRGGHRGSAGRGRLVAVPQSRGRGSRPRAGRCRPSPPRRPAGPARVAGERRIADAVRARAVQGGAGARRAIARPQETAKAGRRPRRRHRRIERLLHPADGRRSEAGSASL